MFSYNILQWLFFFYIYCFVGWIIESTIVSVQEKEFVNRGFLRGPFLPIYGFGAIIILFATLPVKESPALVYICGMIGTTILEYSTAWLMESLLTMKYWDYSGQKFNYKGRICLTSSLFWGFLALFLTYGLHELMQKFVFSLSTNAILAVVILISCYFIFDTVYAVFTALDVNKLLANITRIHNELESLRTQYSEKVESTQYMANSISRMQELKSELSSSFNKINFFNKHFIKAHPGAYSKYFNDALKEVRIKLNEKMSKH